jgi:hypothetical protein
MTKDLPKLRSHDDRTEKVTIYLPKRAAEAYRAGKFNGYDTPEIVRQAATKALMSVEEALIKPLAEKK